MIGFSSKYAEFEEKYSHIICYVYAILSSAFFTVMNFVVKSLPGLTSTEILFYRSIVLFGFTTLWMKSKNMKTHYPSKTINLLLFWRGLFGLFGMSLIYYGVKLLPLSESSVIIQTTPAIVGIFAAIFLKEKYQLSQFFGVFFCFCGVLFVAKPDFLFKLDEETREETNHKFIGIVALLGGTLFIASTQILVKKIASQTNEGITTLYFAAIASMFVPVFSLYQGFHAFSFSELFLILLIGVSSFGEQVLRNKAYIMGNPGKLTIMNYFGILYSMLIDVYILGQELDSYSIMGALCIFCSLFVFLYRTIQQEKQKQSNLTETVIPVATTTTKDN